MTHSKVSRRMFLRGAGASIALPTIASLGRPELMAAAKPAAENLAVTASGAPLRTAFLFFPNGAIPTSWWPVSTGSDYAISSTLKPLEEVRDQFQVMKGLDNVAANPGRDGGGDHARGNATFLTSVRLNKSSTNIRAGISIDQIIANQIGHLTRFPSLELASDPRRQTTRPA